MRQGILANLGSFLQMTAVWGNLQLFQWSCENILGNRKTTLDLAPTIYASFSMAFI